MATHGGTISWKAKELARTIVSGPIGGVIGSKLLGEALGDDNVACSDIGGTSFDMALTWPTAPGPCHVPAYRTKASLHRSFDDATSLCARTCVRHGDTPPQRTRTIGDQRFVEWGCFPN